MPPLLPVGPRGLCPCTKEPAEQQCSLPWEGEFSAPRASVWSCGLGEHVGRTAMKGTSRLFECGHNRALVDVHGVQFPPALRFLLTSLQNIHQYFGFQDPATLSLQGCLIVFLFYVSFTPSCWTRVPVDIHFWHQVTFAGWGCGHLFPSQTRASSALPFFLRWQVAPPFHIDICGAIMFSS